ncbi:hypothetical protein [Mycoplasmoides pirum]|uniref:hypothetical protein n=1 Tax=Mycoplasmoides pirum TaxID=2122 RepID=UPI000AE42377|nr:hypothetical protein [Mycoplasmoides pirum]
MDVINKIGLTSVTPILFKITELLNSKIVCGTIVTPVHIIGIDKAFAKITIGDENNDIEIIIIIGAMIKVKNGPDQDFQKYLLIMFKTPSIFYYI